MELKSLRKETREAARFLFSKTRATVRIQGSQLMLSDTPAKDVKMLLRKFLHHKELDGYRVEVIHSGLVEVFPPREIRPHEDSSSHGTGPSPGATMPYAFPFSPSLPGSSVKKRKKKRP